MSTDTVAAPPAVALGELVRTQIGNVGVVLATYPDRVDVMTHTGGVTSWTTAFISQEDVDPAVARVAVANLVNAWRTAQRDQADVAILLTETRAQVCTAQAERDLARAEVAERDDRWQRFWEAANDFATSQGYCQVYDRFAEEWGAPPRNGTVRVTVTIEATGSNLDLWEIVNPEGVDLDEAQSSVRFNYTVSFDEDIEDVPQSECACEHFDTDQVINFLDNNGLAYDDYDYTLSCPND